MTELVIAQNLAVAALAGLAVGVEREWSGHASGPAARFAGVRTFFLLGLLGGLAGWLTVLVHVAAGIAIVVVAGLLIVAAYATAARRSVEAIDGTTETAALVVLALGVIAGLGEIRLASGATAVIVLVLGEKDAIRRAVTRIGDVEMKAALQFAVMALVVLPLLPTGPYGPGGAIRPRDLWGVVLLFSALNFIGYLIRRAVGDERGYPVAGALGGIISSTAVTLAFARQSRVEPDRAAPLALGAVAASVVLIPRVLLITTALNERFAVRASMALGPMFLAGAVMVWLWWRRDRTHETPVALPSDANPLALGVAIRMAIAFQIVLVLIEVARTQFGTTGIFAGAALVGLTDVDALTLSMSRLGRESSMAILAAQALLIGIVVNTALKSGLAIVLGAPEFRRRVVPALAVLAVTGAAGWWLTAFAGLE